VKMKKVKIPLSYSDTTFGHSKYGFIPRPRRDKEDDGESVASAWVKHMKTMHGMQVAVASGDYFFIDSYDM
jgi:hypothetical protein